jgi:hypothetical protein
MPDIHDYYNFTHFNTLIMLYFCVLAGMSVIWMIGVQLYELQTFWNTPGI